MANSKEQISGRPKSSTVFHFTKKMAILKAILKNGFWPRYCLEDVSQLTVGTFDYIAFPMVCFCDIPLSRISDHVGFYGKFGIGMSREWAERSGLNPLLYLTRGNPLATEMLNINRHANALSTRELKNAAKKTMRYIFAHSKPVEGTTIVRGKPRQKKFYLESEWRYVPKHSEIDEYLAKGKYGDKKRLELANNKTKLHCSLRFGPADVKYIFVSKDSDIPEIIDFIESDLSEYPADVRKLLSSRVLSLDGLHEDL